MTRGCGGVGVADWLGMIALWVAVIGLAIWAVCRLFPTQPAAGTRAADDLSDPGSRPSDPLRGA